MLLFLALGRLRQEDHRLQISWAVIARPGLKIKNKRGWGGKCGSLEEEGSLRMCVRLYSPAVYTSVASCFYHLAHTRPMFSVLEVVKMPILLHIGVCFII